MAHFLKKTWCSQVLETYHDYDEIQSFIYVLEMASQPAISCSYLGILITISVTRLGDFLHFGQQFKAGGNNYFTQIAHIVRQFL